MKLRDAAWQEKLGPELVTILRRARVLHDAGLASSYECGGAHCGERRRIVPSDDGVPGKPYLALCAMDGGCLDLELSEDELRLSTLSFAGAIDLLRGALRIEGVGAAAHIAPDVFLLGVTERGGLRTDAFLALNPDLESFPHFLTARGTAQRASVVFTNTTRWLPQPLVDLHGPGRRVEIALLEDILALRDGAVVATDVMAARVPAAARSPEPPVCVRLDVDGERALSAEEHERMLERAPLDLDFFLDFSVQHHLTAKKTVYIGGRRRAGAYERIEMRASEAAVAAELIERSCKSSGYLRLRDLVAMKDHGKQTFHRAWQQLDPDPRAFLEKEPGSRDVDAAYRFRPQHGRRWALLKPVR
ncbi:MAG: hypothetical protein HYV09_03490 [Deltaproteobacteria bacterium]|nr:hypothetical protein [Deltaproteobacteria bacterium]